MFLDRVLRPFLPPPAPTTTGALMSRVRHASFWLAGSLLLGTSHCPPAYAVPFSYEAMGSGGASTSDQDIFRSFFNGNGSGRSPQFGPFLFTTSGSVNVDTTTDQTFVTGGNAQLNFTFPGNSFSATGPIPPFFPESSLSVTVGMHVNSGTGAFSEGSGQLDASFQGQPTGGFRLTGSGDVSVSLPAASQTGLLSPNRALQTIDDGRAFLTSQRGTDTAKLANAPYPGVSTLPAGYTELTALRINKTDGLAIKFIKGPDGNVTVSLRGTELPTDPSNSLQNWKANFGFPNILPARSDTLSKYLQESTGFVSALEALIKNGNLKSEGIKPDAKITFTGHSLGGALALILGNATGFDAVAYNSPGVAKVLDVYASDLSTLKETHKDNLNPDNANLVNVRMQGDPVSSLVGAQIGKQLELKTDPFGSIAATTPSAPLAAMSALHDHSMGTILQQLNNPLVLSYENAGDPRKDDINWAVKAEYARPLFDQPAPRPPAKSRSEAIQRATQASCLVLAEQ